VSRPDTAAVLAAVKVIVDALAAPAAPEPAAPVLLEEHLVAQRYGVEPRALANARKRGELAGFVVGRRVVLDVVAVEQWIRAQPSARAVAAVAAADDGVKPVSRIKIGARRVGAAR
jgi:hypothetical protein